MGAWQEDVVNTQVLGNTWMNEQMRSCKQDDGEFISKAHVFEINNKATTIDNHVFFYYDVFVSFNACSILCWLFYNI